MTILDRYIRVNKIKTIILIITYIVAVMMVVHVSLTVFLFATITFYNIVMAIFEEAQYAIPYLLAYSKMCIIIWPITALIGIVCLILTLLFMHKNTEFASDLALRNFELTPITINEFKTLNNIVSNLSIAAGIMAPTLEIYDVSGANAFSVGLERGDSTIVLTYGLITSLKADELEAVLAHEVAHIASYDTKMMMIFHYFSSMLSFVTKYKTDNIEYKAKGNIFVRIYLFVISIALLIFYPLLKQLIGVDREYMADKIAVSLTGNPRALADTILKVSALSHVPLIASEHYGTMSFTAATNEYGNFYGRLFNKHPTVGNRISRIMQGEYEGIPSSE